MIVLPWNDILCATTMDYRISIFNSLISSLFNWYAPIRKVRVRKEHAYVLWMTDNIRFMIKLREDALKRFKRVRAAAQLY